jgi:GT2 family glycosyltransferase
MMSPDRRQSPRFSILLPLEAHRGQAFECLRGWADDQTFPRPEFEIVVAVPTGPGHQWNLDEIRSVLAPTDLVLECDLHHDQDLCAEAAAAAGGELLFFTESHCLPEPGTLARADEVARSHPEWAGFSGRSLILTHNLLSEVEAAFYDRHIEFGMMEHPWRKVLDQCFVIRRSAYRDAGGFDPSFGHFAEWLLAARLYARGSTIGFAPETRIRHYYSGELREWRRFTQDFAGGEMRYLALEPPDPLVPMFEEVPEWSSRLNFRREVARRMCFMLLRNLRYTILLRRRQGWRRSDSPHFAHWRLVRTWLWRAVAGPSTGIGRAWARQGRAEVLLRLDILRRDRRRLEERYAACNCSISTLERVRCRRRWIRDRRDASGNGTSHAKRAGSWRPGLLDEPHGVGFHLASGSGSDAIRWSEPAAYVELPLAAGPHVVTLEWAFYHPGVQHDLSFYVDEHRVPDERVALTQDYAELWFETSDPTVPTRLGWVCTPFVAQADNRALGLPVRSIHWESSVSAEGYRPDGAVAP